MFQREIIENIEFWIQEPLQTPQNRWQGLRVSLPLGQSDVIFPSIGINQ